jgi:hypothetical protein
MLAKDSVVSLLKRVFSLRGYRVQPSQAGDFMVVRGDERISVLYAERPEDVVRMSEVLVSGRGLVVFDSEDGGRIASVAYERGFELWDRAQLEREVGKTVIDACVSSANVSFSELLNQGEGFVFEREESVTVNLPAVSLQVAEIEAMSVALREGLNVTSSKLLFVPHWMFSFGLSVEKRFKNRSILLKDRGTGLLNAVSGERVNDVSMKVSDSVTSPTENYEIKEVGITKEDAYARILKYVVERNRREVRINELIGDTIVFEQKTFVPDARDVHISLELIYLPVWQVSGEDGGFVELNAVTGKLLKSCVGDDDVEFIA